MSSSPPPVATVRVARSRPWTLRAAVVAGVLVLVALAKPWATAPRAATTPAPPDRDVAVAASTSPAASGPVVQRVFVPDASLGPDQISCRSAGWQVVSLDRLASWTVRTWLPAAPAVADGPLDAAIPYLTLESPTVVAIGACQPPIGNPDASVGAGAPLGAVWRVTSTGAARFPVERFDLAAAGSTLGVATLYRPVAGRTSGGGWPRGRYVIELTSVDPAFRTSDGGGRRYVGLVVPAGTR